jgi:hypothetical protein
MITKNNRLKCDWCGHFIASNTGMVYTPFGSPLDINPPEEEHVCDTCFKTNEELIRKSSWRAPQPIEEQLEVKFIRLFKKDPAKTGRLLNKLQKGID